MRMNIKKQIGKFYLCIALVTAVGCSDFLDEEDPSNLSSKNFYTEAKHAEAAIAACYADARFIGDGAGIFSSNWQLLEAPTGTSTTQTAQNSDLNNLYSLSWDPNTGHIKNWWRGIYKLIANTNLVLENVPNIPMDDGEKNRVLGEAKFFRAWAYFYAVRLWGDVPLVTIPQQSEASENFYPIRTPQSEVYALIVKDLQEAETSGLAWTDPSGRVSQAAVKSLLAKVYLTMAGQPLNETARYADAAAKAKEVIDNAGPIDLFDTYGEVHDERLNNTVEHIFSLQYNNNSVASNPMGNTRPNFQPVTYRGPEGTGSTVPYVGFYESFEPGDQRAVDREGWFYTHYFKNGNGELFDLGAPYIFKHFNRIANGTVEDDGTPVAGTGQDNLNLPIIRFAEVLLTYAEASNEATGPNQDAVDALKRIRDRAQLATPLLADFTQESLREAVWKERWFELCYEQITWFDMVRLRKVLNTATGNFDDFVGHVNLNVNQPLQAKHLLFPIPRQELVNNPNLETQNPGYEN